MKIAILGATGLIGRCAVQQALDAGHLVTAIVRSAAKITFTHSNLKVVEADIFSQESLKGHLEGYDAVLSCLGFHPRPPVTGYSESTKAVVGAMRAQKIRRLVMVHSWYTSPPSRENAPFIVRWIMIPMIKHILDDMWKAGKWLESDCKDVDYTLVLPTRLTNDAVTDKPFKVVENGFMVPECSGSISRADVARYMLNSLKNEAIYKKGIAIGI